MIRSTGLHSLMAAAALGAGYGSIASTRSGQVVTNVHRPRNDLIYLPEEPKPPTKRQKRRLRGKNK